MTTFLITPGTIPNLETSLLVVFISEEATAAGKLVGLPDELLALATEEGFGGKPKQHALFRAPAGLKAKRLLLVGVGAQRDALERGALCIGAALATRIAYNLRLSNPTLSASSLLSAKDIGAAIEQLVEGAARGAYAYKHNVSAPEGKPHPHIDQVCLALPDQEDNAKALERAIAISKGAALTRDLVNESPLTLVPMELARWGRILADRHNLSCTIFDEHQLQEKGFGLIMAVGKGSDNPPRLVHLTYKPDGATGDEPKIAFVGKGVTFDTGGYNIKTDGHMLHMHCDMAGAAAVLGAAEALGQLKPKGVELHFIVPTVENSVSGNAMRPNDVYTGYSGKTVEIHNTDAEGRLILADALAYAQEQGAQTIIDLATLTGACVVALGDHTSGLFVKDEQLYAELQEAITSSGEDFWRLPLSAKLDSKLDTPFADMKNIGGRMGGAITAALFLQRFVDIERWAHMDIAGPAYTEADTDTAQAGGTGFGVSTLVRFALQRAQA